MSDDKAKVMQSILDVPLTPDQAGLWFLGQAGYVSRAGEISIVIDPYLTDSVGDRSPELTRQVPVPIAPEHLKVDVFIVTHDHLDHLDPDTINAYRHKETTLFIAPRLAATKLASLGVSEDRIHRVDSGETVRLDGVSVTGVYALPTDPTVVDTTGYLLEFANGRSVYHTSDTGFSDLLPVAAPQRPDVLLVCINGKYGNLTADQAARLTAHIHPPVAIPNHYDMMAPNSVDPDTYVRATRQVADTVRVVVLDTMQPFVWSGPE